jgi:hypothetical protein
MLRLRMKKAARKQIHLEDWKAKMREVGRKRKELRRSMGRRMLTREW